MDKELEETIERLNRFSHITILYSNTVAMNVQELKQVQQDIATLVQAVENSIQKEVVKEYLEEEQERFNVYKKESKENENLKLGMWKHLGAKNMCEKILGIERTVVTLN